MRKLFVILIAATSLIISQSCGNGASSENSDSKADSAAVVEKTGDIILNYVEKNVEGVSVLIFNFHSTHRCISCNAIEANTKKTIDTYFTNEKAEGRIKMMVLNVDDEANAKIAERFQATGTSLFIVRVLGEDIKLLDVTGDGFKYAKNNPDQLVEVLKTKIAESLK